MRLDHAKRLNATKALDEKINLYNMTEDVFWRDLDRYMRGTSYNQLNSTVKDGTLRTPKTQKPPTTTSTLLSLQSGPWSPSLAFSSFK